MMHSEEYCPKCRRVTQQVEVLSEKLCKRCGKVSKRLNPFGLIAGHKDFAEDIAHERKETAFHEMMEHLNGGK